VRKGLSAILDDRAQMHPDRLMYAFYAGSGDLRETYTYAAFQRRSTFVAQQLKDAGLKRGEVALLVYPPGIEMALAFFACARIGAIPAPAPPPVQSRRHPSWSRLTHIAEQAGATHILTVSDLTQRLGGEHAPSQPAQRFEIGRDLRWVTTDGFIGELDGLEETASDILFLQYTSGSTSLPRGVAVTHDNLLHNASLTADHEAPVYVSWLPHFHDLALVGCLLTSPVRGGSAHCFSPLDFMRRPVLWLDLISKNRATITAAPNTAYEYCLREDRISDHQLRGIDLGSLRTAVNCAEPIRPETFERFAERFARYGLRKSAYVGGYGLAEHTLCVSTGGLRRHSPAQVGDLERRQPSLVACGRPAPDVTVRIVDPATFRPVADGTIGEIWVDSASKAAGYWRLPEISQERFQAKTAGDSDERRYLRTGDLGFLDDGELFVCGRLTDMVIVSGRNIFPNDIEALLEGAVPSTLTGHVVAFGARQDDASTERLVVLVEAPERAIDLKHLSHLIRDGCDVTAGIVARVPRGTIVRTSSGKVARQHCRDSWQRGLVRQLEVLDFEEEEFKTASIESLIRELEARANAIGRPDAPLEQLGLDSIALVNLSLQLEEILEQAGLASPDMIEQVADLSLLQALRVSDLRDGVSLLRQDSAETGAIPKLLHNAAAVVRRREEGQMLADAALPLPAPNVEVAPDRDVLITGATGFLGAFITRTLIELSDALIWVLVRSDGPARGLARIRHALLGTDMPPDAVSAAIASRIKVVSGDLSLRNFGLSDDAWDALAGSVGRIYHCAAEIDYVKSYGLLRGANVLGTLEVIRLASERRRKSLHYASTTFVHGWSTKPVVYEHDVDQPIEELSFGYAQSKWVAEQLVLRALRSGFDATIYRPSLVTASASGRFVDHDIAARVVGYMIRHGLTVDARNQVSFLPVDICARNIVAISQVQHKSAPILHMTADEYYCMADVCAAISDLYGYRFASVSLEAFVAHAHAHCTRSDPLYPLLSFLDRNTSRILRMEHKRYDSHDYRRVRADAALAVPHPDLHATVRPIVRYLIEEGLVPAASPSGRQDRSSRPPLADNTTASL
jgi:thioester reductase-like protein